MPVYDFICSTCEHVHSNIYVTLADFGTHHEQCSNCLEAYSMDIDLRQKRKRSTRSIKFKEFTLHHTRRLDGSREGREIHSLADIRRFEKEHQNEQVCVEAFSYDSQQHIPDPVQNKPVTMTDDQKRDFVEKFRAMDIKNERSARDYE